MSKAIVFGGSGFLGSFVADELSIRGYEVTIFDRLRSPYLRNDQKMIVGDILDESLVLKSCQNMDIVYNFAGLADINDAKNKPKLTAELNILGNINILEASRINQVKRFVFASTVYVYSESGSFYRASKQASEKFIELYQERYNVPFTILRYGSLYGRRSDERNAIYRFIHEALTKKQINYKGTGDELREYIHAYDAASASVQILSEEYLNQHVIITGHQAMHVRDVMTMISEMIDQEKIAIKFDNGPLEAHYNITPYAYKPRPGKKLVVNPFVDLGQGILDCIHEIAEKLHIDENTK